MVYDPNSTWTAEITSSEQSPAYFVRIDGLSVDYATHEVKNAGTTKQVLMDPPAGGSFALDIIKGTRNVATVTVPLLDIGDEISNLVATEQTTASVSSLINRLATVYGGYRSHDEADYPAIFTGRITGLSMSPDQTAYVLELSDLSQLFDAEIMSSATSASVLSVQGNIANVYYSILADDFTTGGSFPLDTYSANVSGIGIASTSIDTTGIIAERDRWHANDKVLFEFDDPVNAKRFLEAEIFRAFQAFPSVSGAGLISLRFHVPAIPATTAETLTDDEIVSVNSWARLYGDHLNKFTYVGDYSVSANSYDTTLYGIDDADDTANRSNTGETVEYLVESKGMRSTLSGSTIATELAGRMRARYLETPAQLVVSVNFSKRNLEQGDTVAVTHPNIPDLFRGTRGVSGALMTVMSIAPNFTTGLLEITLLDTGYRRFGVISPAATGDYAASTEAEQNSYAWIGEATNNLVGSAEVGYRVI